MARTKETTVYQFDELSERAKERARDWYRQGDDNDTFWAESVIEDAAHMADILGINLRTRPVKLMGGGTRNEPAIYWSGFSSQGDGACFEGTYSYRKGSVKEIAKEAPAGDDKTHKRNNELNQIARDLHAIQRRHFYRLEASINHTGRYSHEHSTTIEVADREDNYRDLGADDEALQDALRDFMHWIYRSLETEYEYQHSDEVVDENIRANEYEFTEDGERA